jgi:hypothetical protein
MNIVIYFNFIFTQILHWLVNFLITGFIKVITNFVNILFRRLNTLEEYGMFQILLRFGSC